MTRRLLLSLGIMIFMGGCSLAPQYAPPLAPIPENWPRAEADQPAGATAITGLNRRDFFADERLLQIIATALVNNRDLRLAALNVERARALYGIQRAELLPAANATGAGGKQRLSADLVGPGDARTKEQYSLNLGVASWEIDFFGRVRSLEDQALEGYLATDEARRGAEITLAAEIARVYLTMAADRENLRLARSTLLNQQESHELARKRFDTGLATELDLRRAQIPVEAARGEVARFTLLTAQDHNALNLLAGAPVAAELLPVDLESVTPPREISPGLPSDALLRRPDILAAEHRLKGANAFIGAARAAFFPRISLTTAIGTASDDLSGLFNSGTNTWSFTPQISMPIFDARVWAAYRVSQADREILLATYEKAIQTAFREAADALAAQASIDQQVAAQEALVNAAAETYRLAGQRFATGLDSYLGVLDAQRAHFAVQQGLVALNLSRLANRVRLYAVLGGGEETGSSM